MSIRFSAILLCLVLAACGTHRSPLQAPSGQQFFFVTNDEEAIFSAAFDAVSEARPGTPVVDLNGSVRGFQGKMRWALDRYTTTIRVFRAEGETANGTTVRGYYPEVT